MSDHLKGFPLFDWRPSAQVEPFPFHRCTPRVRYAALLVTENDAERGASNLRMLEDGIRRHLERAGLGTKTIDRELTAFRQAVENDCNRLKHQPVACSSDDGSAA